MSRSGVNESGEVLRTRAGVDAAIARPATFTLSAWGLVRGRERVAAGDPALEPAVSRLTGEADAAVGVGPFSVTSKERLPPSGDAHDYSSIAAYCWPNPDTPNGLPWIPRDGVQNPERERDDFSRLSAMGRAVRTLALSWWVTGNAEHAVHAARLVRTWFIDPETRMNPHLRYAQYVPGASDGRATGIIDTSGLPAVLDHVALLDGAAAWRDEDAASLRQWVGAYLGWLRESDPGREEAAKGNNHGTWYDVQVAAYALGVGETETAIEVLSAAGRRRIAAQVEPDGRQPHELRRTKSLLYSVYNLAGLVALATEAESVGVDLWRFQTPDGRSIRRALDFVLPYVDNSAVWPYQQIVPIEQEDGLPTLDRLALVLRTAAAAYGEAKYEAALERLPKIDLKAHRVQLVCPSVHQEVPT